MSAQQESWKPVPARRAAVQSPSWRQLNRWLWVGHAGGRVIGTIERGHHFVYVDADGDPRPGWPTLEQAQAATGPIVVPDLPHGPLRSPVLGPLLTVAAALATVGIVLALWVLGTGLVSR